MFKEFSESKISSRVEEIKEDRIRVIIRKVEDVPIPDLVKKLQKLPGVSISGYTDFFIFAQISKGVEASIGVDPDVDRVFKDEPINALLNYSVETTKALATWNTFGHYGEEIIWAVVDSGIKDQHPFFMDWSALNPEVAKKSEEPFHWWSEEDLARYRVPKERGSPANWWNEEELTDHAWFKHMCKDGDRPDVENGFPGNTILMRFLFVKDRQIHQHGTHVAGIIAGNPWRGEVEVFPGPGGSVQTMQPLAPKTKLVDFRVLDHEAKGQASDAIKALFMIRKINEEAGRIIIAGANVSLGFPFSPGEYGCGGSPLCEEVDRLVHSGVLVVVAAGNFGYARFTATLGLSDQDLEMVQQPLFNFQSIADPGNAREAITVGSTHRRHPHRWGISAFSSRGPTGDGRVKPDLLAPGEKIISCNSEFDPNSADPRLFISMNGTSMAAAHVSGALALFLSIHREFIGRPFEVKEKLLASCTDLGREKYLQGQGLLDIFRLAQSV